MVKSKMVDPEIEQTSYFLWRSASCLSATCPAVSRYYVSMLRGLVGNHALCKYRKACTFCKYCGSLWRHSNHRIRIQPIPSPNHHIRKLIKMEKDQPWKLNKQQKKKLKKYRKSTNQIVHTCYVCKKTTPFTLPEKSSPGKAHKKDMPTNTSAPKIKLKKGDLNAGLFISSPIEKKILQKSMEIIPDNQVSSQALSASELMDTSNPNIRSPNVGISDFTSKIVKKNTKPQSTSSSKKKRKKGLLDHILNQEQAAKRQKKSLLSFLTSG